MNRLFLLAGDVNELHFLTFMFVIISATLMGRSYLLTKVNWEWLRNWVVFTVVCLSMGFLSLFTLLFGTYCFLELGR